MNNLVCIWVTKATRDKIRDACKSIYRKYHPDFEDVKISDHFIVEKITDKYELDDLQ